MMWSPYLPTKRYVYIWHDADEKFIMASGIGFELYLGKLGVKVDLFL